MEAADATMSEQQKNDWSSPLEKKKARQKKKGKGGIKYIESDRERPVNSY